MTAILEVCVDGIDGLRSAIAEGAHRVELCSALFDGGLTPSAGMISIARKIITHLRSSLLLFVIIRPRPGDFCYSADEFEVMLEEVRQARHLGADGIVMGILTKEGTVDVARCRQLVREAQGMQVTFHRAIDMSRDLLQALEDIVSIGCVQRILTSGGSNSVIEGEETIAALVRQAAGRIIIVAGGGVTEKNALRLMQRTHASELHFTARKKVSSDMHFRRGDVWMGGALRNDEYALTVADPQKIRSIAQNIRSAL